jgi:hypothetical protein
LATDPARAGSLISLLEDTKALWIDWQHLYLISMPEKYTTALINRNRKTGKVFGTKILKEE